jgi:hypothetical protein
MHLFDQDGDDTLLIDDMEFYVALRDKFGYVILYTRARTHMDVP